MLFDNSMLRVSVNFYFLIKHLMHEKVCTKLHAKNPNRKLLGACVCYIVSFIKTGVVLPIIIDEVINERS